MKKILLYFWQLPQNILGLLVILFTRAVHYDSTDCWETPYYSFGVSLGNYIIFGTRYYRVTEISWKHERGHQKQSLYLGWLYLLIIGIPSLCGNLYDRFFHKNWSMRDSYDWYYNQPVEKWADYLGGVER